MSFIIGCILGGLIGAWMMKTEMEAKQAMEEYKILEAEHEEA